ncbi:MAG: glycoside hydrolase family 3 protein [Lachnospiraceae bacterium]|nr:glycoside hydrolase family 3 protein [Lachnospiraceae bacterium]
MTQEERRLKRQQDTKNAMTLLGGLACIVVALIIVVVLAISFFLKDSEEPVTDTQVATETEYQTESEIVVPETEEPIIDPLTQEAIAVVAGMSLEQKVAQMFIVTPDDLTGANGATVVGNTTKRVYAEYPVGGLVYEKDNFKTREQTQEMLKAMEALSIETVALPIFLSVEEEGGKASVIASKSPIDVDNIKNMSEIGATGDNVKAYEAGQTIGNYLYDLGFNMDFAPVADVLSNTNNSAMAKRSFGSDGAMVGSMVCGALDGLSENNIAGVVKYFPGYGSTGGDGSEGVVSTNKTLEELKASELVPFQLAIDTRAEFIMVGHVSVPSIIGSELPSSLSEYMINQVLRTDMGFEGIVVTDAMNKKAITASYSSAEAAVTAIEAGADIILMPKDFKEAYKGVLEAVRSGEISEERINTSLVRIVKAKLGMY